tara:strand:+ start:2977 stop:4518 length:1542 start_codon:yes stop_codon:yes gene_type:complete
MTFNRIAGLADRWNRRSKDFQRGASNAGLNSTERVVRLLLWLIVVPIFSRQFGDNVLGIMMLVYSLLGLGGVLSLGLTDATVKFVAKYRALHDRASAARVVQTTLCVYLLLGAFGAGIVYLVSPLLVTKVFVISDENTALTILALRIGGLGIAVRFFQSVFQSSLYGFERYDLAAVIGIVENTAAMAISIFLALNGYGLASVLTIIVLMMFGNGVACAVATQRLMKSHPVYWPRLDGQALKECFGFGVYTWFQNVLHQAVANLDSFLIVAVVGSSAVAYYGVANRLIMQVHILGAAAFAFLFPFAARLFEQKDFDRLRSVYHRATTTILVLSTGVLVPLYMFGDSLLAIWMNDSFASGAALVMQLLCIRYAVLPLSIVNSCYLLGMGRVRIQTASVFLSASTILVAQVLLIPRYGIPGAAWAQLASVPLAVLMRWYVERRVLRTIGISATLTYFIPIAVLFACAGLLTPLVAGHRISSVVALLAAMGVVATLSAGAAYGILWLCRRRGWIPVG